MSNETPDIRRQSKGHGIVLRQGEFLLSEPTATDVDEIALCCQDPGIVEWTTVPHPYTRADAAAFVARVAQRGQGGQEYVWAIRRAHGETLIGMVGLDLQEASSAVIGYWLRAEARSQRVMTRILPIIIDFALDHDGLGLNRIEWNAYVGNEPSRAVAVACGFTVEGQVRGGLLQRGIRRDAWIGTLLAGDPRPRWDTMSA